VGVYAAESFKGFKGYIPQALNFWGSFGFGINFSHLLKFVILFPFQICSTIAQPSG